MSLVNVKARLPKNLQSVVDKKIKRKLLREMKSAHDEAGRDAVNLMKSVMLLRKVKATGDLINSVDIKRLKSTSDVLQSVVVFGALDSVGEPYAYYADQGRSAGKPPPYSAIAKWFRAKKLKPRYKESASKAIHRIRVSIGNYGTEGKDFISPARDKIRKQVWQKVNRRLKKIKI